MSNSPQIFELFDGILQDVDGDNSQDSLAHYLDNTITESTDHATRSVSCTSINSSSSQSQQMCMSKNAIHARENRQKKKQYIQSLEKTISSLKEENANLKENSNKMKSDIKDLVSEVSYLKGVLANQSTLAKLIGTMCQTPGLKFYSSISLPGNLDDSSKKSLQENGSISNDENQENKCENEPVRKRICTRKSTRSVNSIQNGDVFEENTKKGVCLHVSGDEVSLELCSSCSNSASNTRKAVLNSVFHVLREKVKKRKK